MCTNVYKMCCLNGCCTSFTRSSSPVNLLSVCLSLRVVAVCIWHFVVSDFNIALPCAIRNKYQVRRFQWCIRLSNLVCVCCPFMSPFVPVCEPGGELQTSSGTLDEGLDEDAEWEDERDMEREACEGEDFIPPKIMVRILAINLKLKTHPEYIRQVFHIYSAKGVSVYLHFSFFPQLISSKVPKAEYVPNIIRRDDPSIIPILYVSSSFISPIYSGL